MFDVPPPRRIQDILSSSTDLGRSCDVAQSWLANILVSLLIRKFTAERVLGMVGNRLCDL